MACPFSHQGDGDVRPDYSGGVKTLLLMRHAKSSSNNLTGDDHERPLTDRGQRDAARVGDLLRDHDIIPDVIITSDAVRAYTTARAVAEAAGCQTVIEMNPLLYHASPDAIRAVLHSIPEPGPDSVMIVAHNPGLEQLVEQFTGESHGFPTAALVHLALQVEEWSELNVATEGTIIDLWRPDDQ